MIRFVGGYITRAHNIDSNPAPKYSNVNFRILTGDDSRLHSGRTIAVFEVPLKEGRVYFTAAELRSFAELMDATAD